PAIHEIDDSRQAGLRIHQEVTDLKRFPLPWIAVHRLLARTHAELPLKELRNGGIRRVTHQQHDLLIIVVALVAAVPRIVLQVVIMAEEQLWNRAHLPVQIVESDKLTFRQAMADLINPADQHPQPGAPSLAVRDKNRIRL